MTRTKAQAKFDAKIAALSVDAAIEAYTMLRQSVFAERAAGKRVDRAVSQAMVMTGSALEKIIGEDAFEILMDEIDAVS